MADPGWLPFDCITYDVIDTCYELQRKHFWTYYPPSKFRCYSFDILGVKEVRPPAPVQEEQKNKQQKNKNKNKNKRKKKKKRALNRVKIRRR